MDAFSFGKPVLVCRWRLADSKIPLLNRHLRALAARKTNGVPVGKPLVAWAKQHLEWTLADGTREHPDGVVMLAIDEGGRAAMSSGPYVPLSHTSANDLLYRALSGRKEALQTGVSPEDLWIVDGNELLWGSVAGLAPSGASSLVADLAQTLGMSFVRDEVLLERVQSQGFGAREVFLVSDEHGIVSASDRTGPRSQKFEQGYAKLCRRR